MLPPHRFGLITHRRPTPLEPLPKTCCGSVRGSVLLYCCRLSWFCELSADTEAALVVLSAVAFSLDALAVFLLARKYARCSDMAADAVRNDLIVVTVARHWL